MARLLARHPTHHSHRPTAGTSAIIEARGISKIYRTGKISVAALNGVDLTVERGEMVAIMGPSGCGKTTLLNCLSGLDTIDEGQILINGTDPSTLSDDERTEFRAREMGFIFQFYNLLPVLSAVENVELPLLVSGARPKAARQRALAALEQVGLGEWADRRPSELSGGQRQRVTIARALVNDPAIVWGDEPTGDLDSQNAGEIMALMRDLNRRNNQTFVLVTHDRAVGAACDRIIRMKDGKIVSDGLEQAAAVESEPAIGKTAAADPQMERVALPTAAYAEGSDAR
ncbi:MAG TPA: ABC transporter ATP-binding protein [Thermomicrobiales bacterium]|nr:ABC transporter ATP-binding protein [Thermomicrobiales bacterium]